jgi:hypothetical protein
MSEKYSDDRISTVIGLARHLEVLGLFRNCINCMHWVEPTKKQPNSPTGCGKEQALPPPRIIAHGCDNHTDLIPF